MARSRAPSNALGTAPRGGMQRYPAVGGAAAWRLPLLTTMLALAGLALDVWALAASVVVLGWVGHRLWRSVVIEVSPDGLARGLVLEEGFVGPTSSMSWYSVVAVETHWWAPDDHRALETDVRSREGTTIRISTSMGCRSYWACLAEVVQRAPGAVRSGLTDAALASGPPTRREILGGAKSAAALALVLGALIGVGYVLAQGRSSLSRYLDDTAALLPRGREECRAGPRIEAGALTAGCGPNGDAERARGQ